MHFSININISKRFGRVTHTIVRFCIEFFTNVVYITYPAVYYEQSLLGALIVRRDEFVDIAIVYVVIRGTSTREKTKDGRYKRWELD